MLKLSYESLEFLLETAHQVLPRCGVGAKWRMDYDEGEYTVEEIVEWDPPNCLVLRMAETSMSYTSAETSYHLEATDFGTRVTLSKRYSLRYGRFGRLVDSLVVSGLHRALMRRGLRDLRNHLERGRPTSGCS